MKASMLLPCACAFAAACSATPPIPGALAAPDAELLDLRGHAVGSHRFFTHRPER